MLHGGHGHHQPTVKRSVIQNIDSSNFCVRYHNVCVSVGIQYKSDDKLTTKRAKAEKEKLAERRIVY